MSYSNILSFPIGQDLVLKHISYSSFNFPFFQSFSLYLFTFFFSLIFDLFLRLPFKISYSTIANSSLSLYLSVSLARLRYRIQTEVIAHLGSRGQWGCLSAGGRVSLSSSRAKNSLPVYRKSPNSSLAAPVARCVRPAAAHPTSNPAPPRPAPPGPENQLALLLAGQCQMTWVADFGASFEFFLRISGFFDNRGCVGGGGGGGHALFTWGSVVYLFTCLFTS